jgi:hypothetical protein
MRRASELTAVIKRRLVDEEAAGALRSFETFFYGWLARANPALLHEIHERTELSPDLRAALASAVQHARRELDGDREDGGEA